MKLSTSSHGASVALGPLFGMFARIAKCTAIAAPVLMISIAGSSAQEASKSHLDAAKSAINASRATAPLDAILPNLAIRVKSTLIGARPDISDAISDAVDNAAIKLAARRGDLENEVASIYVKVFTEEELKAIAGFFSSDAGKKLLSDGPIIERQIKESSRTWSAGIQRDLSQAVRKTLKEMEKKPAE